MKVETVIKQLATFQQIMERYGGKIDFQYYQVLPMPKHMLDVKCKNIFGFDEKIDFQN